MTEYLLLTDGKKNYFINKEGRMVAKSHRILPNYKDVLSRSLDR